MGFTEYFYWRRLGGTSYKVAAGGTPAALATLADGALFRFCFFDQHYGDAVEDWV